MVSTFYSEFMNFVENMVFFLSGPKQGVLDSSGCMISTFFSDLNEFREKLQFIFISGPKLIQAYTYSKNMYISEFSTRSLSLGPGT